MGGFDSRRVVCLTARAGLLAASVRRYSGIVPAAAEVSLIAGTAGGLRARDLCALIADDDGRGRLVAIRQFCKDWAVAEDSARREMIADAPRRLRWWHRFTARRFDLRRIAAVVAALCERDGLAAPQWVDASRARRPVTLAEPRFPANPWNDYVRSEAPQACARHSVWFRPADIEDHRVHGFS